MQCNNTVLVLEDELNIRSFIKVNLKREGYEVIDVGGGKEAIDIIKSKPIDVAILDIMLPDISGLEVLKKIRQDYDMGAILLSAKGQIDDKIEGLKLGADDYVVKPFSPKELVLRVNALMKRLKKHNDRVILLDKKSRSLKKNGKMIELTSTEYEILNILYNSKNKAFSRDYIMDRVWGVDYFGSINTLDVNISRLRRKIEDDHASPMLIKTVRGHGYMWSEET